jgi:hypothetical protein
VLILSNLSLISYLIQKENGVLAQFQCWLLDTSLETLDEYQTGSGLTFLQILDEYHPSSGLLVAVTNQH